MLALRQTAGRGRHGREWQAPEGNLSLSVLLRPQTGLLDGPSLALVFAVAVHRTIAQLAGSDAAVTLKWPNDVLLNGGKVGGILVEGSAAGTSCYLVVGIGVNLASAPMLPERRTSCLADVMHRPLAPESFGAHLLLTLQEALEALAGTGFAPLRQAWLDAAHPVGSMLYVSLPDGVSIEGRFAGLSHDGALLLDRGSVVETIRTGEVLLA